MGNANMTARVKMKRCLAQAPLQVKEWVVKLRALILMMEQSRLFMFTIECFQFGMVLWLLFGNSKSHVIFVSCGIVVIFPISFCESFDGLYRSRKSARNH